MPDADDEVDYKGSQRGREHLARRAFQPFPGDGADPAEGLRERERIEHVVAHPRPERDVPAPPVVLKAQGEDGPFEILREVYAQHLRHAAGDVDAAREVAVELHAVGQRSEGHDRAVPVPHVPEHRVRHDARALGDDELPEIAPHCQLYAVFELVPVEAPLRAQLILKVAEARDRPLYDLREERHEQRVLAEVPLRLHLPPVAVHDIAHGLKGEERQAQRQYQLEREALTPEQSRKRLEREAEVLEHKELAEGQQAERQHDQPFAPCRHAPLLLRQLLHFSVQAPQKQARPPGQKRGKSEVRDRRAPAEDIKAAARREQQRPLALFRQHIVQQYQRRDKYQKSDRRERH